MTKMTFHTALPADDWILLATGDDTTVGLQAVSELQVAIYIGSTEPDLNVTDYLIMEKDKTRELALDLPSGQFIWARGENRDTEIRGFRTAA